MPKKKDNFLDKIVKKNYNNELEEVLEKKNFEENTKSLLLSILYKIETAYPDYEMVKRDVESKDEFIESIINIIKNDCEDITLVKLHSTESELLKDRTFLVDKKNKKIICYPIERKVLYCISKIGKKDKIVKDKYYLLNWTLSELLNVGNSINMVEPMRDFNGYSWTTLPKEIESIPHNLVYQNLRMLVGNEFLRKWVTNREYIIDYFDLFKKRMEKDYGVKLAQKFIDSISTISILLCIRLEDKIRKKMQNDKKDVESKLKIMNNNHDFVEKLTQEKINLTRDIRTIDETINNKHLLQEEYDKRNEKLPLEKKIFSTRVLAKTLEHEREKKLDRIEKVNELLNPKNFVEYKKELKNKEELLKWLEIDNIDSEIEKTLKNLQKQFLDCYKIKVQKAETKQEATDLMYQFRYYCLLPFDYTKDINDLEGAFQKQKEEIQMQLVQKVYDQKITNEKEAVEELFSTRAIELPKWHKFAKKGGKNI